MAAMPSNDTTFYAAWLLCHDDEFARQNATVRPEVFPRGSLRYLVSLAAQQWRDYRTPLSQAIVQAVTENDSSALRKAGADKGQVRVVYQGLNDAYAVDDASRPTLRQLARTWLERRALLVAIERAGSAAEQGKLDDARLLLGTAQLADATQRTIVRLNAGSQDHLQVLRKPKRGAFPTGFPELDAAWEGGYRRGDLGMVVAPTGVGKSMMLCYLAAQAFWLGAYTLYYTFELTPTQIRDRISLAILERGKLNVKGTWAEEIAAATKRHIPALSSVPAAEIDIRGDAMTWPGIVADLEECKIQVGKYPDLLLLDSADDVAPINRRERTHEQLKDAFVFLRAEIALGRRMRVWTSGQLNRESIERAHKSGQGRVDLRQIGDSFAKAQKSHYVLALAQSEADRGHMNGPQIQLYVLKDSNHGTPGAWLECSALFGSGSNGYPGFEVEKTHHLPGAI